MSALVQSVGKRHTVEASLATDALFVVLGSVLMAGLAQLSIRLPFTPVPVTGQTLGVMLIGGSLGAVQGSLSILLYLAEGAAGLPVFAEAQGGVTWLITADPFHTTGGYLWGFVAAAFVIGLVSQRKWGRGVGGAIGAMLIGEVVIFATGVPWVAYALHISGERALELALYPFIVGEVAKILIAAGTLATAWRFVGTGSLHGT